MPSLLRYPRLWVGATLLLISPPAQGDSGKQEACISTYEGAQRARKDAKLLEARRLLEQCVSGACKAPFAGDCARWLSEVSEAVPSLVVSAVDEQGNDIVDAELAIDGTKVADSLDGKAIELDPGRHSVQISLGARSHKQTVVVRQGEKSRALVFNLAEPQSKSPQPDQPTRPVATTRPTPWPVYALGGAGIVSAGIGGFLVFQAAGDNSDLNKTCKPNCTQDQVDDVNRKFALGYGGIALGAVLLGASAVVYLTRPEVAAEAARRQKWQANVALVPGGAFGHFGAAF